MRAANISALLWVAIFCTLCECRKDKRTVLEKTNVYTNVWVVEMIGGPEVVEEFARKYGFQNRGPVSLGRM